jgi:hypothetical protein
LWIANVGDSRAVLCGATMPPHTPNDNDAATSQSLVDSDTISVALGGDGKGIGDSDIEDNDNNDNDNNDDQKSAVERRAQFVQLTEDAKPTSAVIHIEN